MADAGKYGNIEIEGVGEDEPVFILRSKDLRAPAAVRAYARIIASRGAGAEDRMAFAEHVDRVADEMERWQQSHAGEVKEPD